MPWKKGESGNKKGRPPVNLCVTSQLLKILGRTNQAELLARSIIAAARKGDASMVREVLDRVEGKIPTTINQNIRGDLSVSVGLATGNDDSNATAD